MEVLRRHRRITVLSLGAGVQSTTLALLAAEGVLPKPDAAIFADTGWEPKAVYRHLNALERVLRRSGIPVHRVQAGNLRNDALDPNKPAHLPTFVRNEEGDLGKTPRTCTDRYKLRPIREDIRLMLGAREGAQRPCSKCDGTGFRIAPWRAKLGVTEIGACSVCEGEGWTSRVGNPPNGAVAVQWIGFSTDEIKRVKPTRVRYLRDRYPLLELNMSRDDCQAWLDERGWGKTPKSACVGCPFHNNAQWRNLRDNDPVGWDDAIDMDASIRNEEGMRGQQYLHRSLLPLAQAPIEEEMAGDPDGCSPYGCRSGEAVA